MTAPTRARTRVQQSTPSPHTPTPHHTSARAGRATYLVVPETEGPKTVIGNPVERLGEFGNHLVIPKAGTEYYPMKDKAPMRMYGSVRVHEVLFRAPRLARSLACANLRASRRQPGDVVSLGHASAPRDSRSFSRLHSGGCRPGAEWEGSSLRGWVVGAWVEIRASRWGSRLCGCSQSRSSTTRVKFLPLPRETCCVWQRCERSCHAQPLLVEHGPNANQPA